MLRPIAFYIGFRYTRAVRRKRFVSFISLVSMLGIALGVTALITVLSVVNGFNYQISQQFFSVVPAITITAQDDMLGTWRPLSKMVERCSGVQAQAIAPFIEGKGMLMKQNRVSGVEVMGVLPLEEQTISAIPHKMLSGRFNALQAGHYRIVLGVKLAATLGVVVGDTVHLFIPQTNTTPFGMLPRFRQFTVGGIFKTGNGFGFDDGVAYVHMADAKKLYSRDQVMGGVHVKLYDPFGAAQIAARLNQVLPHRFYVSDWTQFFGTFFQTLAMEKTMMCVILMLIVTVAVFNLVSTLMMTVEDKRTDIAILRTMGATRGTILGIFIVQGGLIGLIGTLLGVVGGVLLALNVTAIVNVIQECLHVQFVSADVYFIDYLPSRLQLMDVMKITIFTFLLSIVATIYPAWIAARTEPAEALRYE